MQTAYLFLDVVSALATLTAVGFFVRVWLRTRAPLHLLLGAGFLLLAASYPFVASSQLDLAGDADAFDALRFLGQTGGALALALAYVASHGGRAARPLHVLGWSAAIAVLLVGVLVVLLRPVGQLPAEHDVALVAHVVQAACFATCAALSSTAFRRVRTPERALVPAAFLVLAAGKAIWLPIDAGGSEAMMLLVYGCRLLGLALLILALAMPVRLPASPRVRPRGGAA